MEDKKSTSCLLKTAGVFVGIALVLQAISVGTDYWVVRKEGRETRWHAGVFTYALKMAIEPRGIEALVYPILTLISIFLLIVTFILNIAYFFRYIPGMLHFMIGTTALSELLTVIVVVMWAVPHLQLGLLLHYSFGLSLVVIFTVCGALILYSVALHLHVPHTARYFQSENPTISTTHLTEEGQYR